MRGEVQGEEPRCWLEDLPGHRVRGLARDCDVLVKDVWGPFVRVLRFEKQISSTSPLFFRERPGGNPLLLNLGQALVAAEDLGIWRDPDERQAKAEAQAAREETPERRL